MDDDNIIGGMGVIENDFHDWKDLSPNSGQFFAVSCGGGIFLFNIAVCLQKNAGEALE
jgi:hypothetical protein